MKSAIKSNLLKLFALIVAVCAGVAIATLPNAKKVSANEEAPAFTVEAEFRANVKGELDGLNFKTSVNDAWLQQNKATEIGTIVFPMSNVDAFDYEGTDIAVINKAVDGIRFISNLSDNGYSYNATILFDEETVKSFELVTEENFASAMQRFYTMEFAALPYAIVDGELQYPADPIKSNFFQEVILAVTDPELKEDAKEYIPVEVVESDAKAYISKEDGVLVIKEGYSANDFNGFLLDGEVLNYGEHFTVVDDSIVFYDFVYENFSGYETLLVATSDSLIIYNVLFADKALKTAEEVEEVFDYGDQKLGDHFAR